MKYFKLLIFLLSITCLFSCKVIVENSNYRYEEADKYTKYEGKVVLNQTIETIDISWISGSISIIDGEEFSIYEEDCDVPLYYYAEDLFVRIRFSESDSSYDLFKSLNKKLQITIPNNLNELKIYQISGSYNINVEKNIDIVNIETVSAEGELRNKQILELKEYTVSGDLNVTADRIISITSETVSGNLHIDMLSTGSLDSVKYATVSGNLTLIGDGVKGYRFDNFTTTSGSKKLDFKSEDATSSDKFKIDFESVSGNIIIKKRDNE